MIKIRDITGSDRCEFLKMVEDLYSSEAALTRFNEQHVLENYRNALSGSVFCRALIFEECGEICGYAFLAFSYGTSCGGRCIWLEELYFKPPFRNCGFGKYFLKWLIKHYSSGLFKEIRLELTSENKSARRLYEKFNFVDNKYEQMHYMF